MPFLPEERSCVLDASALLAMLQEEPGGELVQELLETAAISSVNWSEVAQKALDWESDIEGLRLELEALGLQILPFTAAIAEVTARLRSNTRQAGLSLGDRACLALAAMLSLPAVTADRIWSDAGLPVEIRVIR
ncbi:MAG TPA: type II toxin-antitoxin system VapC family toxin [Thermoanaerobaculia bacterium]|jgi:PIN domain nuclease of toxin-antitoxin system|nr:type II toxin-antitoxin system VapC family toxin [Thermoanaerobaculia bacterium]